MKACVFSYSLSGNNGALASSIAAELGATHIRISESRPRTTATIFLDILFNRTPRVIPTDAEIDHDAIAILVGPVWMGHVATPLRSILHRLKSSSASYAFVSISGGADGPNAKLADELKRRVGREPALLFDLHIADLLPPESRPTRKDTSAYRLTDSDVATLTIKEVKALRSAIARL